MCAVCSSRRWLNAALTALMENKGGGIHATSMRTQNCALVPLMKRNESRVKEWGSWNKQWRVYQWEGWIKQNNKKEQSQRSGVKQSSNGGMESKQAGMSSECTTTASRRRHWNRCNETQGEAEKNVNKTARCSREDGHRTNTVVDRWLGFLFACDDGRAVVISLAERADGKLVIHRSSHLCCIQRFKHPGKPCLTMTT